MNAKDGFYFLLLTTIFGEFFVPWVLQHFYKGYNSKNMVMSALGNPESPVKNIYNIWLIWLGVFLVFTAFVTFQTNRKISIVLAVLISATIIIFAIGAGILAGMFSVNESKDVVTIASKIHGVGSAIGFMVLLFFPLLNSLIAFKNSDNIQGIICVIAFLFAVLFFVLFILADKEQFKQTVISSEGLWERLTLFFMYVPFVYVSIQNLIK